MFGDTNSLPISGGVVLAGLIHIGTSVFVTGPLIAERSIEKSNWTTMCPAALKRKIEVQQQDASGVPNINCRSIAAVLNPQWGSLCKSYKDSGLRQLVTGLLGVQERLQEQTTDLALTNELSRVTSRCDCAAAFVAEKRAWAIHAGSLRLVRPPTVRNLNSELTRALGAPHCSVSSRS